VEKRLTEFLYLLMRDELPICKISHFVRRLDDDHPNNGFDGDRPYSNEALTEIARGFAQKILRTKTLPPSDPALETNTDDGPWS
jgi:hypothetical protein